MRTGSYEASENASCAGTAVTFLLIGLGAGALIGLLLAPKSGRLLRKDIRRGYENARETIEDWKKEARDFAEDAMERGSEIAEDIKERVTPLARNLRRS